MSPMVTKIRNDNNLATTVSAPVQRIIRAVPPTGRSAYKLGNGLLTSKKKIAPQMASSPVIDAIFLLVLFNLKLELFYNNNPSQQDIENYKEKAKEYQNLFRPIPGQLYRHNLLNEMELHNSISVYDSAWKRSKVNIHDKPVISDLNHNNIIIESLPAMDYQMQTA